MLRKKIYTWHRRISLIIAAPVVLWAASGFMHPLMTTIRPQVATQFLMPSVIDSSKLIATLQTALQKNKIEQFHNFRLVHIDTNWFYQVQLQAGGTPLYLSTSNGKSLYNGDRLYAQYIAKLFLEGKPKPSFEEGLTASLNNSVIQASAENITTPAKTAGEHDCCDAATNCVLLNEKGSKVSAVAPINNFDDEYKFINRLLPVYKVNFERADGIRIYVETTADRFAFAVDNKRAAFDKIFSWLHNWSWIDAAGKGKYVVMAILLSLAFITTLMGLYIFFITKTKQPAGNTLLKARRNHRFTSVAISLFTLMFTFSGAFHALEKLKEDNRYDFYTKQNINTAAANLNTSLLQMKVQKPITNISAVQINNQLYWQVQTKPERKNKSGDNSPGQDLMKNKTVLPPNATYVSAADYSILPDGEKKFAQYLAGLFSNHKEKEITSTESIVKFEGEYGFVNKRLPVWKVSYPSNANERLYVETSSGTLSVRVDDTDLYEGYSFAMLHKHHFMDWAGKGVRDFSTMFWALAQIAMVAVGVVLWRKSQKKNK